MQHQSFSGMKACALSFVLGAILLTSLAAAQSTSPQGTSFLATGTYRLTVTARELSLDSSEASLAAILTEIGQRTKIPIVLMSPGVDERITIHLSPMPLDKALKQLSPNVAIATAQGPNAPPHRIVKVYVLPKSQDRPSQLAGNVTSSDVSETRVAGGSVMPSLAERPAPFQFTFDPSQHMKQSQ